MRDVIPILYLLLIPLLIIVLLTYPFWQKRLVRFLNQRVLQPQAYREGLQLVSQPLEFTARASIEQIRSAVLSTVQVAPSVPALIKDAFIVENEHDHILYGYGHQLNRTVFSAILQFQSVDEGVHGTWHILNWVEAYGLVVGYSVMKRLVADINTALAKVDPKARLRPVSTPGAQRGVP